jgi:hypothetical protein
LSEIRLKRLDSLCWHRVEPPVAWVPIKHDTDLMAADPILKRGREKGFELGSEACRYAREKRIIRGKTRRNVG